MQHHHPVDLKAIAFTAMTKYGFKPDFPPSVLREVSMMMPDVPPAGPDKARDLRTLLW